MPALVADIHDFLERYERRGCPGLARPQSYIRSAASARTCGSFRALATALCVTWPSWTLSPLRKCGSSESARRRPDSASASTNGRVTLLSANVDVRATAPGMLVTQ